MTCVGEGTSAWHGLQTTQLFYCPLPTYNQIFLDTGFFHMAGSYSYSMCCIASVTFQFTPGNQRVAEESGAVQVCVEQLNGTVSNETLIILLNPTAGSAGTCIANV